MRPALAREYWLENLLLRMTAVERNDRIATAAEALELMQEALAETRPAPAAMVRPQPRVPPEIAEDTAAAEHETLDAPAAVSGAALVDLRAETAASAPADGDNAVAPALSPEPQILPPADLQHPPPPPQWGGPPGLPSSPPTQPPLQAFEDTAIEHEVPIEALASTGGTGEEPQVEPTASADMPASAAVPADDESAPLPSLPPEPQVPPPAELQQPLPPPPWVPEDASTEHEVPGVTPAVSGGTDEELHAEPTASAETPANAATPADERSGKDLAELPEPGERAVKEPAIAPPSCARSLGQETFRNAESR